MKEFNLTEIRKIIKYNEDIDKQIEKIKLETVEHIISLEKSKMEVDFKQTKEVGLCDYISNKYPGRFKYDSEMIDYYHNLEAKYEELEGQ